jgi:hypothetical protein
MYSENNPIGFMESLTLPNFADSPTERSAMHRLILRLLRMPTRGRTSGDTKTKPGAMEVPHAATDLVRGAVQRRIFSAAAEFPSFDRRRSGLH